LKAGETLREPTGGNEVARATPPHNDPDHAWLVGKWDKNLLELTIGGKG
jgi:hypothetical protein